MAYREIANGGCSGGTCPTFWQDDETGDVKVRGYEPGHVGDPARELDVVIPAVTWRHMVPQLPR
jgi:hypothetical protein